MADLTVSSDIDTLMGSADNAEARGNLELGTGDSPTFTDLTLSGDLTVDTTTLHVKSSTDRVGIGTTNPSTKLHISDAANATFRTGSGTRRIDFNSYSGDWNYAQSTGAPFVFGTADAQPLHLYTNNTKKASLSSGGNFSITSGSLTFDANSGSWNGATISGDQTMSGQVELTAQAASTDDSAMTRLLSEQWAMSNLGRQYGINLASPDTATSGTGASATYGVGRIAVGSGSATSGYGRATILYGVHGLPSGAYFSRPIKAAITVALNESSVTSTSSGFRFWVGSQTPTAFSADALSAAGFGVEYAPDGSNYRIRAFAHDGSTYSTGSWVNFATGSLVTQGHRSVIIESDGSGNISATISGAFGETSTVYTSTTTGGPTSYSASNGRLNVSSSNNATGTPSSMFVEVRSAMLMAE